MKAMIFAAGLGTRLRPLTDSMPKALVPVGGIPMLQRVMMKLKAAGILSRYAKGKPDLNAERKAIEEAVVGKYGRRSK